VREVQQYLGGRVDRVVLHNGSFPEHLLEAYAAQQQYPVMPDLEAVSALVPSVTVNHLTAIGRDHFVRHDPERLLGAALGSLDDEF
jgi:hypothetical protein